MKSEKSRFVNSDFSGFVNRNFLEFRPPKGGFLCLANSDFSEFGQNSDRVISYVRVAARVSRFDTPNEINDLRRFYPFVQVIGLFSISICVYEIRNVCITPSMCDNHKIRFTSHHAHIRLILSITTRTNR